MNITKLLDALKKEEIIPLGISIIHEGLRFVIEIAADDRFIATCHYESKVVIGTAGFAWGIGKSAKESCNDALLHMRNAEKKLKEDK